MKKYFLSFILLLGLVPVTEAQWTALSSAKPSAARVELLSSDIFTSVVHFSLEGFYLNEVKTPAGSEFTVSVGKSTPILEKGAPDLSKLSISLIIPDQGIMDVEILSSSFTDYPGISIAPSKGNLNRDTDPASIPFEYGNAYRQNKFYPEQRASLRDPFILRDYRGQTLLVNPFAYNPVTKVLRVYSDITVRVYQSAKQGINVINRSSFPRKTDSDFAQVYRERFLNSVNRDYIPLDDYGRMLIISYGPFMQAMQPFVQWKNAMGIRTEMVDVAGIGNTADAIKSFVTNYYTTNGLTFLLLVGDEPQIPTNTEGVAGPSDNAYGYLLGNDHYPDIFVGRFSAENISQVNTMVQRTIEYEENPFTASGWWPNGIGIGSDQGPGDDNEYDYQHIRNIRNKLLGFTYTSVAELYDGTQGGEDQPGNPTPAMVAEKVNNGATIINYCGHGSQTSWGTSGFSNTEVNQLSNNHKWPFILSVACVNGDFTSGTCFAEAWLRAKNDTGPTGAVAAFMSTINQSWNPPMDGEDEMDDLLAGIHPENAKQSFGGITLNGCSLMNDDYGAGGFDMTDTWTIFGDPSLLLRTAMPEAMTVTHAGQVFTGSGSFTVNVNAEGALAGLSLNGQYLGSGFVQNGSVTISFPALLNPDTLHLVVTAFNRLPYEAEIPVIPNNGSFLIYNANQINDAACNNNGLADYGETVKMSLALSNIGILPAGNVLVTLSTADPFITLTDSTENYGTIAAGDTTSAADGFGFKLANTIPDQHLIPFHFEALSGTDSWSGNFSVTAHAGKLDFVSYTVSDPAGNNNGKADPGETFQLLITIQNNGSATATNVSAQLSLNDPWVNLLSSSAQCFGNLEAGALQQRSYTLAADPQTPEGYIAYCAYLMAADLGLHTTASFSLNIGQIPVAVIDLDGNTNSGPLIQNALTANNVFGEYKTAMPADISGYHTLFVCLGTNSHKHVLTSAEGQQLANFLSNGGRLYMEGGDTWFADPKTAVHPMFKVNGVMDGSGDLLLETGQSGTFGDSLVFSYIGDNEFIDHLAPLSTAFSLFKNSNPLYISAVAYDQGTYRTIASGFEFGGLSNADFPSTLNEYMRRIIEFFGILYTPLTANFIGYPVNLCEGGTVSFSNFSTGGANTWHWAFPGGIPAESNDPAPDVSYSTPGNYDVTLIASNGLYSDTLIRPSYVAVNYCTGIESSEAQQVKLYPNPTSGTAILTSGTLRGKATIRVSSALGEVISTTELSVVFPLTTINLSGKPEGLYYVTITTNDQQLVRKLILQK